jgi:hypothetical protein
LTFMTCSGAKMTFYMEQEVAPLRTANSWDKKKVSSDGLNMVFSFHVQLLRNKHRRT